VLYLSIGGTDLINFFKQFAGFGLKGTMQISGAIMNDSDAWTLGPGVMTGVWPNKQDWGEIVAVYPGPNDALDSIESTMTENPMILQNKYPLSVDKK